MDYTQDIEIDLPRDRVIALFDDPDNLPKWQEGLQSFEHLTGEPGQPGATSRLVFQQGKRRIEMIETITARNLPDSFDGTYDAKGVRSIAENRFVVVSPERTRWVAHNVFEFSGPMKIIGLLFGRTFPKQTMKYMQAFKTFAEDGTEVPR